MIDGPRRMFRIAVGKRHPVKRHDFKCLSIELQVQITICRGIHDAPKLPLVRRNFDSRANCPIHGKDFLDCLRFSPTSLSRDFNVLPEFSCIRIMLYGTAAHNEHTLTESPHFGRITLHSLDDDRSRHSVQYLAVTLTMWMSVIPEETWRMIARNLNRVVQNVARRGQHTKDVVLRRVRRDGEPVKMQVRHVHAWIHRTSLRRLDRKVVDVGDFENVTRGSTDHRGHICTVKSEGIPAILVHSMKRKGNNVILRSHLRWFRQRNSLGPAHGCEQYLRSQEE